jgi:hypothetical protein
VNAVPLARAHESPRVFRVILPAEDLETSVAFYPDLLAIVDEGKRRRSPERGSGGRHDQPGVARSLSSSYSLQ